MSDSFCAYRFPGDTSVYIFKGNLSDGLFPGFVIAPFDLCIHTPLSIQNLKNADWSDFFLMMETDNSANHVFRLPVVSTTEQEHSFEVNTIVSELGGNQGSKTIAAKAICSDTVIDAMESFESLCSAFANSFIFLFYTPLSGAWLGASPEILLEVKNNALRTYALAGTRPAGVSGEWDYKNVKEQEIVEKYIIDVLKRENIGSIRSSRSTRVAGKVEHILTEIEGLIESPVDILEFLRDLSPTPALCGFPKIESMNRISRLENFQRGYYGGFCGPMFSDNDFKFYVNLRSISFERSRWCMFAGGGITASSKAKDEWIETERKAESIIKNLKFLSR